MPQNYSAPMAQRVATMRSPDHLASVLIDEPWIGECLAGRLVITGIPQNAVLVATWHRPERRAFQLVLAHDSFTRVMRHDEPPALPITAHHYMDDGTVITEAPNGVTNVRTITEPTPEWQALLQRALSAVYALRNGGADDPYVISRPPEIDDTDAQSVDQDDDGSTRVAVADDITFCIVPAYEGAVQLDTAHQIAGAGKLIADLVTEIQRLHRQALGVRG
jgi:hypothetical protein